MYIINITTHVSSVVLLLFLFFLICCFFLALLPKEIVFRFFKKRQNQIYIKI